MKQLTCFSEQEARRLDGLFFDLDDTLLEHGQLSEKVFRSLFRLKDSGLKLFALTGRPATWADFIARVWPVDGAVAENGALAFALIEGRLRTFDPVAPAERALRRVRLATLVEEVKAAHPELVPADDAHQRVSDYTFDIGEHERAKSETIESAMLFGRAHGAKMTRSSVHLHFGFDREDKATGAIRFLSSLGVDPSRALQKYAFIGDSENDAPAFAGFRTSVGVANLRGRLSVTPRYVTTHPRGDGFVEFVERLTSLRP